jgi:hypothetical protein
MTKTAHFRPRLPVSAPVDNRSLHEHYVFAINNAIETGHDDWVSELADQYAAELAADKRRR